MTFSSGRFIQIFCKVHIHLGIFEYNFGCLNTSVTTCFTMLDLIIVKTKDLSIRSNYLSKNKLFVVPVF